MSDFTRQFQMSLVSYSYHLIIIYILSFFSSKTSSWVLFLHRKKQTFPDITVSLVSYCCFLAHLSWKLKWAFLITCCPSSVCPSVCLSVNFSHFHLLLQNHWANFKQTWYKVSLGEGDSSLFKWRATPFPNAR